MALLDLLLEVLVVAAITRTSNFDRARRSKPARLRLPADAQHLGLRLGRHVADFVQEDGALSACSNLPTCFRWRRKTSPSRGRNSSDSISSSGIAAQFTWTNRSRLRRLLR